MAPTDTGERRRGSDKASKQTVWITLLVCALVAMGAGEAVTLVEALGAVSSIRQVRVQACEDQDVRNANAHAALQGLIAGHMTPGAQAQANATIVGAAAIVDAIIPDRDCATINDAQPSRPARKLP